jgi:hypothetical protein
MSWIVLFHDDFEPEFNQLAEDVQDELLAHAKLLQIYGPQLGRPTVDTLKGSELPNLKELRFTVGKQQWRVAFAFDPLRQAILLMAGNKTGANQSRFYSRLIASSVARFQTHLLQLKEEQNAQKP